MSTNFHKGCQLLERHRTSDGSHILSFFQGASHRVVSQWTQLSLHILELHDILAIFVSLVRHKDTNVSFLELLIWPCTSLTILAHRSPSDQISSPNYRLRCFIGYLLWFFHNSSSEMVNNHVLVMTSICFYFSLHHLILVAVTSCLSLVVQCEIYKWNNFSIENDF